MKLVKHHWTKNISQVSSNYQTTTVPMVGNKTAAFYTA